MLHVSFSDEYIFALFFQTSMSASPIPWGVGFVGEPASTPRDPTCVPVPTAGGLWEGAGRVKVKQDTFYKQILEIILVTVPISGNNFFFGKPNFYWFILHVCNFMVNYGTCISVDIAIGYCVSVELL